MAKFIAHRVTDLPTSNIDEKGIYFLRSGNKVTIYVRYNNNWELVGGTGDVEKVNGLTGEVEIDLDFTSGQLKVISSGTGTPITTTSINLDTRYERLSNKVQNLNNPNSTTYPSTQAIADLDLDDFKNESSDPFVRESEMSGIELDGIGTRNYLHNSDFSLPNPLDGWVSNSNVTRYMLGDNLVWEVITQAQANRVQRSFDLFEIGEFTYSIKFKATTDINEARFQSPAGVSHSSKWIDLTGDWQVATVNLTNSTPGTNKNIKLYFPDAEVGSTVEIEWVKLEKTNIPSDWTPSPEDQKEWVNDNYQQKLTAGANITISGNVISASGGGSYNAGTKAQLDTGTNTESRVWAAKTLADWLAGKGYITSYHDTTYSAGNGLTLTGTQFSLPITITGSGTYVQSVVQTENGITVTLGTPPNTTYSAGTQALLEAGTNTSNRVWSAKTLSDWTMQVINELAIMPIVEVKNSNYTLVNADHMKTLVTSDNTITIQPSNNYGDSFQIAIKNDHPSLPTSISFRSRSGYTYRVNDEADFSENRVYTLANGGTCTIIRKADENRFLADGDLDQNINS